MSIAVHVPCLAKGDKKSNALPNSDSIDFSTPLTIAVLLDESGSMECKTADTIGGFNGFIQKQLCNPGAENVKVFLTKFSDSQRKLFTGVPLKEMPKLDKSHYEPCGNTALYDSIAYLARQVDDDLFKRQTEKKLEISSNAQQNKCCHCGNVSEEEPAPSTSNVSAPAKVIFVIITDGEENASTNIDKRGIQKLIEEKQRKGWVFLYLGENDEKWTSTMKTSQKNARNIEEFKSIEGIFHTVSDGLTNARKGMSTVDCILSKK